MISGLNAYPSGPAAHFLSSERTLKMAAYGGLMNRLNGR